jgi:hypothetical protein
MKPNISYNSGTQSRLLSNQKKRKKKAIEAEMMAKE